jgi:2-polyprenyl-3-methyl-5-hydroxy-6-metoxy-1,4-benzoquinol methylase
VLDIGCGGGEPIARHLIGRGCRVAGIDSSPRLVAAGRARVPHRDVEGAEWQVADMRAIDLGRRFDGLIAWDRVFHLGFADQRRVVGTFARHAAPLAALMFTSGPAHGEAIGAFEGEPLCHASLAPSEYRALLGRHGFDLVAHRAEDPACGGHTVWLARLR